MFSPSLSHTDTHTRTHTCTSTTQSSIHRDSPRRKLAAHHFSLFLLIDLKNRIQAVKLPLVLFLPPRIYFLSSMPNLLHIPLPSDTYPQNAQVNTRPTKAYAPELTADTQKRNNKALVVASLSPCHCCQGSRRWQADRTRHNTMRWALENKRGLIPAFGYEKRGPVGERIKAGAKLAAMQGERGGKRSSRRC